MWTVDDPPSHASLVRAIGCPPEVQGRYTRIPLEPWLPMGDAILRREALFFESRADYRGRYPVSQGRGNDVDASHELSYACLPLVVHGRAIGGVSIVFRDARGFDEDERVFLNVLAHHAAQALDRATLFEREKATLERLERLQQLTGAMSSAATVEEIARLATQVGTEALGVAASAIWATDERGDLRMLAAYGTRESSVGPFRHVPADSDLPAARVARERRALYHESYADIASEPPAIAEVMGQGDAFRAYCALPLVRDDRVVGVLSFGAGRPRRFSQDERAFAATIAEHCADALARARLYDQARRAERRLQSVLDVEKVARTSADAASRAKDEFLAMLGHELRNPLAPILTALHLMRLRGGGSLERETAIIERQVSHLMRLVDDLLDVSRVIRGDLRLERSPVEVAAVVADAIEVAGPLVEGQMHQLTVEVPRVGLLLDADPQRITQVVTNLLTNAAKYTPAGGHITVRARVDAQGIVIEVADDGAGIAPELLPVVFDPFTQGRQGLDRKEGGLGLGLAIARQLVVAHGGTIEARSDGLGRGTTIVVRLPRAAVTPSAAVRPHDVWQRRPGGAAQRRVLVVDDNPDAAELLHEVLTHVGHEVRTAADAPSALQLVQAFAPDIAFLDIGLPVMDGYELALQLRRTSHLATTPLVAVTGYAQDDDRQRALASGFNEHLAKPLAPERVLECIERLCPIVDCVPRAATARSAASSPSSST
jgi:signal transduction histidine kinase/ActR/RegA family two-component response regulator